MQSLRPLLDPKAIAVIGASQQPGRGTSVIANLRDGGFKGGIFAVNPRYSDVLGYPCVPSVETLPDTVDCIVIAIPASPACDVMEQALARGIRSAIVLAGGFEGPLASRLKALARKGMAICGPNSFGLINIKTGAVAFNGVVPKALQRGPVALVSQSGSLGNFAFGPLMRDRRVGFSYFVSCGNQAGTTIEDYAEYVLADPDVKVIAAIIEDLKDPPKLQRVAAAARAARKPVVVLHVGRSQAGQAMTRSHTGALAGNAEIVAAFLRRCGIMQAHDHDEFVEMVALMAHLPLDRVSGREVVLVSGSGGGAALAADHLDAAGLRLAKLDASTEERLRAVLPDIGSVTNPIDATGAVFYDPSIMTRLLDAVTRDPGRPVVVTAVNAVPAPHDRMRKIAAAIAEAGRTAPCPVVAYQVSPLGPLDGDVVASLHAANIPLLLGVASTMGALGHLSDTNPRPAETSAVVATAHSGRWDFLGARQALVASGVAVVEAELVSTAHAAVAALRKFGGPVALKAEAEGLLHKSDIGCVRLDCATEAEVAAAYREIIDNAKRAGFASVKVLVQPMAAGVAEAYAGIIDDPLYGLAIVLGLGGIFVEILKDTAIEMAPLDRDTALAMIGRLKAAPLLAGVRGRPAGDVEALAALLVRLGQFALTNRGAFRALDLNPIIVKRAGEGVMAVDIAVEAHDTAAAEAKA